VTWAFVLEPCSGNATRLIVRARAGGGYYRFHGLPPWISDPAIRLVHFVDATEAVVGIAERVRPISEASLDRPAKPTSD
jgi:hypothetical protein